MIGWLSFSDSLPGYGNKKDAVVSRVLVSFGVVVNAARTIGKQLSFITTGQEVPDHIEPGRADRIARLVLGHGAES